MIAKKRQKNYYFQPKILPIPVGRRLGRIYFTSKKDEEERKEHEKATARILIRFSHNVYFIEATNSPTLKDNKSNNPDCRWNGKKWELKSPTGNSEATIARNVAEAINQCKCVIVDVSRMRRTVEQAAKDTANYLVGRGGLRWEEIVILDKKEYCKITKDMLK